MSAVDLSFGTTTTRPTRNEATEYGERVADARGWILLRVERLGKEWTPVWTYPEDSNQDDAPAMRRDADQPQPVDAPSHVDCAPSGGEPQ